MDANDYLLGMKSPEVQRLQRQHEAWSPATTRLWQLAGFSPGHRIIDLGCGPGFASLELGLLVGKQGRIIAVDSSAKAINHLRNTLHQTGSENVEIVESAVEMFDPRSYQVNAVFARWLFCFLRNPEAF
jgi:16S rRNA G527 N7-methylase RsmG